ncbi:MAG: tetratricopeptide repeat protein [Bacteroidetes bacterium]|nr:tetratricopeptide repeat protein [Bacteroidota bacterium]
MSSKTKKSPAVQIPSTQKKIGAVWLGLLLVITFFTYYPSLQNNFLTNWDDHQYVLNNDDIKQLNSTNIKKMFTNYYIGNYQPITILSYALDYHFWQLNPKGYKTINLLFHLLNTLLVFQIVNSISKQKNISIITAAVFALHPMHVESVAWISERKDVLYSFFYLLSIKFYLSYLNTKKIIQFIYVLLFFVLSILSKSAAITLPLVLACITWYQQKEKHSLKNYLPIVLLLLISIVFGVVAIDSQKEAGATNMGPPFPITDRPFLIAYAILFYVVKFIAPINLCAMYYYPAKADGLLPVEYYISALALIALGWYIYKIKFLKKEILFGLLFFLFSISLTIQLIPIGRTIAADRYSYIPFIGLGFIVGNLYQHFIKKKIIGYVIAVIFLVFTGLTYQQTMLWKDVTVLFSDVIKKNPEVAHPYWVRAAVESELKQYDAAMKDFNEGIKYDSTFAEAFNNRGNISYNLKDYETAIKDYSKAIALDSNYQLPYNNRASCKRNMKDYKGAIEDYTKAIENDSTFFVGLHNRGLVKYTLQDYEGAIKDFDRTIQLKPDYADAYSNRGVSYYYLKNYPLALENYNKAIELNPNYSEAYSNRAAVKYYTNDLKGACDDWGKALQLNFSGAKQMLDTYCK